MNLSDMAEVAAHELWKTNPKRRVEYTVAKGMKVRGDFELLKIVIENLLNNAWKFTSKTKNAHIEFGTLPTQEPKSRREDRLFRQGQRRRF